ncbi:Polyferredoxin [Methylocella tundrae]|uniref:Polyferredoxin n=1 Tax=Methylocella tundrae TaxID=227605 RepID=A0A8B6MCF5_METTU|nr:Polyferredoxin [Methylocella tundrae]
MAYLVARETEADLAGGPSAQGGEPPRRSPLSRALGHFGDWLRLHQKLIRRVQWVVVFAYLLLVAVPAFLPLPERTAHIWTNLTLFAQFAFWGVWWPFVLLSMVLVGRTWCGVFCPEGALTEMVSRHGRGLAVPRWVTWKFWPFVAFVCTTIYGQMISVYQYPKPALLILGGSTAGAIGIGYLYGRNKRVWCRYLCPVNGVFGLLAKLAPVHFRVDEEAWSRSRHAHNAGVRRVNCAPLVPLRLMKGNHDCHMCGRCSGFRDAIELAPRSPNQEIVEVAGAAPKPVETLLIVFGLMGVAAGAFHWGASPWYVEIKQDLATWLIDSGVMWPLQASAPWWIFTNYPDVNDQLTLLDGAVLIFYIAATAVAIGALVSACLYGATRSLGAYASERYHHLAQSLIPIAACGVFLGLSMTTVSLLRAEGVSFAFLSLLRAGLLGGAALWSIVLAWRIAGRWTKSPLRRFAATAGAGLAASIGVFSWALLFWIW